MSKSFGARLRLCLGGLTLSLLGSSGVLAAAPAGDAAQAAPSDAATVGAETPAAEGVEIGPSEPPAPVVSEAPDETSQAPALVREVFELPPANAMDPYGPRPEGIPVLTRAQVLSYAMHNPLVKAAGAKVEAMEAQARKAKWSWLPVIRSSAIVSPGVNIQCDDVALQTEDGQGQSFRYCRSGDGDLDVQTISGYLQQLGDAGVAIRLSVDAVFPLFTFGKIKQARKMADIGVAAAQLEAQATRQETRRLVAEAVAGLLLARESIRILDEGWEVLQKERKKMVPAGGEEDWESDIEDSADPRDIIKLEVGELELARKMRVARKMEALALSALWALAGEAAPRGFNLAQGQLLPRAPKGGLEPLSAYQAKAARLRPEAKMASALVDVRRAQERLARSMFLPDLGLLVGARYGWANKADDYGPALYYTGRPNFSSVNFALALNWNLDFYNRTFDLQKARAESKRADYQRDAARMLLAMEVEQAYRDYRSAAADAQFAELARDKSWQLVISEQQRESIGKADFEKLSKALIAWAEYEFDHFEAIQTQNVALAALERAVGEVLVDEKTLEAATDEDAGPAHASESGKSETSPGSSGTPPG